MVNPKVGLRTPRVSQQSGADGGGCWDVTDVWRYTFAITPLLLTVQQVGVPSFPWDIEMQQCSTVREECICRPRESRAPQPFLGET